jgi:hypothetical protein
MNLRSLGTTTYGGPQASAGTSTSPFHFHNLHAHHATPAQDCRWDPHLLPLLQALHCSIIIKGTKSSVARKVVVTIFFFIVLHYNPFFSMTGPTNVTGYETISKNMVVNGP